MIFTEKKKILYTPTIGFFGGGFRSLDSARGGTGSIEKKIGYSQSFFGQAQSSISPLTPLRRERDSFSRDGTTNSKIKNNYFSFSIFTFVRFHTGYRTSLDHAYRT